MPRRWRSRTCSGLAARLLAISVTPLVLVGCIIEAGDKAVWNRTDQFVFVYRVVDGEEHQAGPLLSPGMRTSMQFLPDGTCVDVELIARTRAGVEVDRRDGSICPEEEWVIDGVPPAKSPSPSIPTPVPT